MKPEYRKELRTIERRITSAKKNISRLTDKAIKELKKIELKFDKARSVASKVLVRETTRQIEGFEKEIKLFERRSDILTGRLS